MKKALIIIIPAAIAITALKVFDSKNAHQEGLGMPTHKADNISNHDKNSLNFNNPFKIVSGKNKKDINKARTLIETTSRNTAELPDQNSPIKEVATATTASPWHINNSYINERYQFAPQVHEKMPVNINAGQVNALEVGSQMEIMLPDYSKHTAVISGITYNGSSKTMTGHLANSKTSEIIITAGRNSVYATVATPTGSYSMQSADGEGVLYKVPPRSDIETLETDALIPDNS
ncbi:hypothetical protein [Endozoicomonas sp. Mp262]|uniref:hypothetical protein n=1 Tax=Endozoicomonas sp. Mp262 TaxID=2919499 RepID=UPI0021DB5F7F